MGVTRSDAPEPEMDEVSITWDAAHTLRGHGMNLTDVLVTVRNHGLSPTWRTVARLSGRDMWGQVPSEAAVEFLGAMIGANPGLRLLDPWAGAGVLLAGLAEASGAQSCRGIVYQADLEAVAKELLPGAVWQVGEPLVEVSELRDQQARFDLVVSYPPWGMRSTGSSRAPDGDQRIEKLALEDRLLLASCELLSEAGRALFVLPNAFLTRPGAIARQLLEERGFHIWSVIALPASWSPNTSIAGNVIDLRRSPTSELFVGKASPNSPNSALIANFTERRPGKVPEVGALVKPQRFSTWEQFENDLAFESAAESFDAPVVRLADVLLSKFLGNRTADGGFTDHPNAVFMPALGTSPAVTSRSELTIKPHNYIQLVLDPALANAEYVAHYLNTPIGVLTRRTVYTGAVIHKASLKTIDLAPIVLPPLDRQLHVVGLQRRIVELRAELEAMQRDLWRSKSGASSASRALQAFPKGDSLETWLPRLPFPLASILWNYQATVDTRRKIDILFAFFEATAEFLTTILLSGLRSNPTIYQELKMGPLSELGGEHWRVATLGSWVVAGSNLAKTVRRMLSDEHAVCLDLFRCSGNWLDAMAGKDLLATLRRVVDRRNEWMGHSGIESDREAEQRLSSLQVELTSMFTPLTLAFEDLALIRPKSLQYDGQVYDVVAEELTGMAVPFREKRWHTVRPLKSGGLFLLERDGHDALELLPFLRMRAGTPADTACYFYSRLGKDGAHFVSYHQAEDSAVVEQDLELAMLINDLTGSTDG
jgi:hypothetical protein